MSQADRIRAFVAENIVRPARKKGAASLSIRAGDVHRLMGLSNAHPAVCSVMGGAKLSSEAGIRLTRREGPANGANVWFHYDLVDRSDVLPVRPRTAPRSRSTTVMPTPDFESALTIISCTKDKLSRAASARDLYCSSAFRMKRHLVEKANGAWVILSAEHGVIQPAQIVEPYDTTLTTMGANARRAWALNLIPVLLPLAIPFGKVIVLAGRSYSEHIIGPLADEGIEIVEPLAGLRQGEQLAWLSARQ